MPASGGRLGPKAPTPAAMKMQRASIRVPAEVVSRHPSPAGSTVQSVSLEFYVAEGQVKLTQQPSFLQLSRQNAAIFYTPRTQWTRCTAQDWKPAQE